MQVHGRKVNCGGRILNHLLLNHTPICAYGYENIMRRKVRGWLLGEKPPPGLEHRANEWRELCDFFDNDPTYKVTTLHVEHIYLSQI